MGLEIGRLDHGEVDEWLKPGPRDWNRHLDPPSLRRARAYAAVALDLLAEGRPGKLEEQAKFVAACYSRALHNDNCTSGTVKKWRERFKKGQVKDTISTAIFDKKNKVIEISKIALEKAGETPSARAIAELVLIQMQRECSGDKT